MESQSGTPAEVESSWHVGLCANCLEPLDPAAVGHRHSVFCDGFCHRRAGDIRYAYNVIRDERIQDPMTAMVLYGNHVNFFALDMAYVRDRVPEDLRREVLEANDGLCVVCDTEQATEVDHINGGSNERDNLRGLCRACHELKPRGPIPEDLTRAGLETVDGTETNTALLQAWRAAIMSRVPYVPEDPIPEWAELQALAQDLIETRFGRLTAYILGDELTAPAHQKDWATVWARYGRMTREWARDELRKGPRRKAAVGV